MNLRCKLFGYNRGTHRFRYLSLNLSHLRGSHSINLRAKVSRKHQATEQLAGALTPFFRNLATTSRNTQRLGVTVSFTHGILESFNHIDLLCLSIQPGGVEYSALSSSSSTAPTLMVSCHLARPGDFSLNLRRCRVSRNHVSTELLTW